MRQVIVVDDEPSICLAITRALRNLPVEVTTFTDPEQALEQIAAKSNVFLIISDLSMPKMDGLIFLTKVREVSPKAFRVLLTATGSSALALECMESGLLHRYVAKPWDNARLRNAVMSLLNQ